jgi:hypothetical protein
MVKNKGCSFASYNNFYYYKKMSTGIMIIAAVLFVYLPLLYGDFIGAPFVAINKRAARVMLRAAGLKDEDIAYDLGAGTGRILIIAKKDFKKKIYGIEVAPLLLLLGRLNLLLHRMSPSQLKLGNFFKMDFKNTNVFFCYLMPKVMNKLAPKFKTEAKKGTLVISYAFKIESWEPKRIIHEPGLSAVYVYEV